MSTTDNLTDVEAAALIHVLEDAPQVQRRHQFFIWSQHDFQTLLPHKVMVCGSYDRHRRALSYHLFNSVVLSPESMTALAEGELIRSAVQQWIAAGGRAITISSASFTARAGEEAGRLFAESGCDRLLLHGMARPQRPNELESLFVFATRADGKENRLGLLLPHIHSTWRQVQSVEHDMQADPSRATRLGPTEALRVRNAVTLRERQILLWIREGKSNPQIGEQLHISPLTVKNHVQKILRKLQAANRAQAVANALALNLLDRDDSSLA